MWLCGFLVLTTVVLWITCVSTVPVNTEPQYQIPPVNQDNPYPILLHEYEVTRLQDAHNKPILLGDGTYANVTLAKIKQRGTSTNQFVAIKTFVDSSFNTIMREVRIHRYVESLNVTPRLIGLLPGGHSSSNISLVFEYLPFSKTISSWLKSDPGLTVTQWLNVCVQLTEIFQKIHSRDVIYNDLHVGNVMIQRFDDNDDDVKVRIIDFGFATYKYGKPYASYSASLYYYTYLAPEVKNHSITSKETDIYSLGNIFYHIAKKARIRKLMVLSHRCKKDSPQDRPSLKYVMTNLQMLLFENWLQCLSNSNSKIGRTAIHPPVCPQYPTYKSNALNGTQHTDSAPNSGGKFKNEYYNHQKSGDRVGEADIKLDLQDDDDDAFPILDWLGSIRETVSPQCPVVLHLLDRRDIAKRSKLITSSESGAIRLSKLLSNHQYVIIKDFKTSSFTEIRQEACNTAVCGRLGISPKVRGLLVNYPDLATVSIVQEYFGAGQTLYDFLLDSDSYDWDWKALLQVPMNPFHLSFDDESIDEDCEPSESRTVFNAVVYHSRNAICDRWSHRQIALQYIAENLTSILISSHRHGYIVNNLNSHNIIVRSDFATKEFQVKVIDLGHVTRLKGGALTQGYEYLSEFPYLAPEVKLGRLSSFTSDVYSLCYLIGVLLGDYISAVIGRDVKSWPRIMKTKYETLFGNGNPCFKGSNRRDVYLSHGCDGCAPVTCEYISHATPYSIGDRVCDYIQLESYLFTCLKGPSECRPSLYSLLKLLKRINRRR